MYSSQTTSPLTSPLFSDSTPLTSPETRLTTHSASSYVPTTSVLEGITSGAYRTHPDKYLYSFTATNGKSGVDFNSRSGGRMTNKLRFSVDRFQSLKTQEILKEFETNKFFQIKKIEKLIRKATRKYNKLLIRSKKEKNLEKFNGEYLYMKLEVQSIVLAKLHHVVKLREFYGELIKTISEYEDPYKTDNEKKAIEPHIVSKCEEFTEMLKLFDYLDNELIKLMKILDKTVYYNYYNVHKLKFWLWEKWIH